MCNYRSGFWTTSWKKHHRKVLCSLLIWLFPMFTLFNFAKMILCAWMGRAVRSSFILYFQNVVYSWMYNRKSGEVISVDTVILWSCLKLPEMNSVLKQKVTFLRTDAWEGPCLVWFSRDSLESLCFLAAVKLFAQVITNHGFYVSERGRKTKTNLLELFLTSPRGSVVRTPLPSSILCHFILFNGL